MDVRVGWWRKLSAEQLMLSSCDVGEESWESLGLQDIKPFNAKGNQCWIFIGRPDVEAETPILWPPDAKNWLIWKDPDAGKDWGWEEKGMTRWNGWMAWPTQWTWVWVISGSWWWTGWPGVLQSMGCKVSDTTERLNWMPNDSISKLLNTDYMINIVLYIYIHTHIHDTVVNNLLWSFNSKGETGKE